MHWNSFGISLLLLLFRFAVLAQYPPTAKAGEQLSSAAATISKYSIAQQRLLVVSTAQFTNWINQNNLDKDSVLLMACHITGMPFLLPYGEGFADKVSGGEDLINSGRITDAVQVLKHSAGEQQIQLLLEIGNWYLHQPGSHKNDLDSADLYIELAKHLSQANKYIKWENECRFLLGELYYQKGNVPESKEIFMQLVASGQQEGNPETVARAYQQFGALLPASDSMKKTYYQRSMQLYQKLQLKEKEIELLWNIAACDLSAGSRLVEKDLLQMITVMQSSGFKHVLYTENLLSSTCGRQGKYVEALAHANAAFENMKWSGIDAVAGAMYIRFGSLDEALDKNEEALLWFKKALGTRKGETHVFWYKSLLFATTLLMNTNPEASLSLIDTITRQFPPLTVWERLQLLSIKGVCYEKLNKPGPADENYMSFLQLSDQYPLENRSGELTSTYLLLGNFYVSRSNAKKARLFLTKASVNPAVNIDIDAMKYGLLFRIDSLEGNYKLAMQDHIQYKRYDDSTFALDQRIKLDELTVKYAAEKKDQDIKLLQQHEKVQQAELKQGAFTRNIMIANTALMSVILILLFSRFRMKQRTNKEMNKRNLALKKLVGEKEWLLKEVHHRVKNNLQTIISLLESQAAYLENDALKAIGTSQNRIYTMSLIHQKLYQSDDIQTIDMANYIPELIKYLKDSFENSHKIAFTVKIDQINLDASIAIPLALIINEALTNSIKYAFPGNRRGEIFLSLQEEGELLKLELADNGIGMDMNAGKENPVSLGLQLIRGLTKEIHGDISFKSRFGVTITILFKKIALEYADIIAPDVIKED